MEVWKYAVLPERGNFKTTVSMGMVMAANFWDIHRTILIGFVSCGVLVTAIPGWAC
jgi:hypothetical protein